MERCNTAQAGRMNIGGSKIGTFERHTPTGVLNTTQGRYPANLILEHKPTCRQVGTKTIKPNRGAPTRGVVAWSRVYRKGFGVERPTRGQTIGYADSSGFETVESWSCHPDCPVADLDAQSMAGGMHGAGKERRNSRDLTGKRTGMFPMHGAGGHRFGDTGGASRFFKTVQDEPE